MTEVSDAAGAAVELAGEGAANEAYLLKLRAEATRAPKKPTRKGRSRA